MRNTERATAMVLLVACVLLGLAGCARQAETKRTTPDDSNQTSAEPTVTEGADPQTTDVRVYFAKGETVGVVGRAVPQTKATAAAAMAELLGGPNATEESWGFGTEIPAGTRLNGVVIADGVATVDLSPEFASGGGSLSMQLRAAEVVYTLTQFSTVKTVRFEIDGVVVQALGGEGLIVMPPAGREAYENVTPAILVESPVPGATVSSPVRISGSSNTFEAAFLAEVSAADGSTLGNLDGMATSGTGTRGTFDALLSFDGGSGGEGSIVVYELSAKDGALANEYAVPVTLD